MSWLATLTVGQTIPMALLTTWAPNLHWADRLGVPGHLGGHSQARSPLRQGWDPGSCCLASSLKIRTLGGLRQMKPVRLLVSPNLFPSPPTAKPTGRAEDTSSSRETASGPQTTNAERIPAATTETPSPGAAYHLSFRSSRTRLWLKHSGPAGNRSEGQAAKCGHQLRSASVILQG